MVLFFKRSVSYVCCCCFTGFCSILPGCPRLLSSPLASPVASPTWSPRGSAHSSPSLSPQANPTGLPDAANFQLGGDEDGDVLVMWKNCGFFEPWFFDVFCFLLKRRNVLRFWSLDFVNMAGNGKVWQKQSTWFGNGRVMWADPGGLHADRRTRQWPLNCSWDSYMSRRDSNNHSTNFKWVWLRAWSIEVCT